jgi:hypothetical protein
MLGAIVGVYVIWGLWSTSLQLQGYDLPAFIAGRIPHLRDTLIGVIIVAVLLLNPRGLLPEQARVSRWLDRRVAALRRSEALTPLARHHAQRAPGTRPTAAGEGE